MSAEYRCDGVSRRDLLKLGVVSSFGFSLGDFLRWQSAAPSAGKREMSCILIWLDGGPSHLDTFDPKPDAPSEIRGDFKAIGTSVPGIQLCEHLPRTAAIMSQIALVRSLTHELGNHDTGSHFMLTGHRPSPIIEYPSLGSVIAKEAGFKGSVPPYVAVPDAVASAKSGYLASQYGPFSVGEDFIKTGKVRDLTPPEGVSFDRLDRRRSMLKIMDGFSKIVEELPYSRGRDAFYEQAYRLIASPEAKGAFDLGKEPLSMRQRYGGHKLGTSCLLARRLVEAGARFVTVVDKGWDTHQQIFKALPDAFFPGSGKLPALDQAYSALIQDLGSRGLLDSTLVVLMGEFGRTPKLNSLGGRDHWPRAGSVLLAGAGLKVGQVIGATDAYGEAPSERPVTPQDLAATILTALGVDPTRETTTPDGRPVKLLAGGEPIQELF